MPRRKDMVNNARPPMKHFNPVTSIISRFLLRNLLRLLSIPQKRQAPIMSKFPRMFSVRESRRNSPFVVTKTTPISNMKMLRYSLLVPRSFRKTTAINTVNSDSALRSRDALIAVVSLRPFRSSKGAIIEPQRITKARILKSLLAILVSDSGVSNKARILLQSGEAWIPKRKTPPMK